MAIVPAGGRDSSGKEEPGVRISGAVQRTHAGAGKLGAVQEVEVRHPELAGRDRRASLGAGGFVQQSLWRRQPSAGGGVQGFGGGSVENVQADFAAGQGGVKNIANEMPTWFVILA